MAGVAALTQPGPLMRPTHTNRRTPALAMHCDRDAHLAPGDEGTPFVVALIEARLANRNDPLVESYLGERMDLMVETLAEMGAPIDPRWRGADW
jgi:hypothetical protein